VELVTFVEILAAIVIINVHVKVHVRSTRWCWGDDWGIGEVEAVFPQGVPNESGGKGCMITKRVV